MEEKKTMEDRKELKELSQDEEKQIIGGRGRNNGNNFCRNCCYIDLDNLQDGKAWCKQKDHFESPDKFSICPWFVKR